MAVSPGAAGEFEPLFFMRTEGGVHRAERGHRLRPVRPLAPLLHDLLLAEYEPAGEREPASAASQSAAPDPDPEPSITREELEEAVAAARQEGLRDGLERGRAAARQETEANLADAVEALAAQLRAEAEAHREAVARSSADLDLALGIARAVIPRTLAQAPLADVEPMLTELLAGLVDQAKLELRLPPDLLEPGRALIAEAAARAGYAGEWVVASDPDLDKGDACLRWDDGVAERRVAAILDEIEGILRDQADAARFDQAVTEDTSGRERTADEGEQS